MEKGASNAAKRDGSSSSHYTKTEVVLREWWLVRSQKEFEGRTLSVSGFPAEEQAVRVFTSAPIVKRLSSFRLETSDGVHVILLGRINRQRTEEGGFQFQAQVFKLCGFPSNWEEYAERKSGDDGCRRTTEANHRDKESEIRDLKEQVSNLSSLVKQLDMENDELKKKLQNSTLKGSGNPIDVTNTAGSSQPVGCSCTRKSWCKTNKCQCQATGVTCGTSCECDPDQCVNRKIHKCQCCRELLVKLREVISNFSEVELAE